MGVERRVDVVCFQEPSRGRGDIGISYSAYRRRRMKRVRTAIRKGSGLVVDQRTDLSRAANNNDIFPDIRRRDEKIMRIVDV